MPDFKAKNPNPISAVTPLGELTALPDLLTEFKEPTSKGLEENGSEIRGREGMGREGRGGDPKDWFTPHVRNTLIAEPI